MTQTGQRTYRAVQRTAALTLGCALALFAQFKPIPASHCALPVDSTVVIEYPMGSAPQTVTLTSDPNSIPEVDTSAQNPRDKTMTTKFLSLNQSGTIGGRPIHSRLAPNVPSTGTVSNVTQNSPGHLGKGHHTFNLRMEYTIDLGNNKQVVMYNKQPIRVEADIASTSPTGSVYRMTNSPAQLYDRQRPSQVVARITSLENRVHQ